MTISINIFETHFLSQAFPDMYIYLDKNVFLITS